MESVNAVCVEIPGRCERLIEVDAYETDDLVIVPRQVFLYSGDDCKTKKWTCACEGYERE